MNVLNLHLLYCYIHLEGFINADWGQRVIVHSERCIQTDSLPLPCPPGPTPGCSWMLSLNRVRGGTNSTRPAFSLSRFISVTHSYAQISNLYLLEYSEEEQKKKLQYFRNSPTTYKWHLKLIVHGGVEGGGVFSIEVKHVEAAVYIAWAIALKENNLFLWVGNEILRLWLEK